jgi:hypothetical protein
MSAHPSILLEEKGSKEIMVTILGAGKVSLKAVINIQQTSNNTGKNDIKVFCKFYLDNNRVEDILKLEESSELLELITFYQTSVKDKQLLTEFTHRKKAEKISTNIITRIASPFKDAMLQYNYTKDFLLRSWSNIAMVNIYTINGGPDDNTRTHKIIARTVIEVDADVLTIINSEYFNTRLIGHLFLLHLSNVAIAGQFFALPAHEGLSDTLNKMQKFLKKGFWYAGLTGFAILEFVSLVHFAILNNRLPFFPGEWEPYVWPIITPAIVIVLRLLAPQIISLLVRHTLKKFLKNDNLR